MSNGLNAGGAPMQMVRDLGTPGVVQGFRTNEPTQGPRLSVGLAFNYLFQAATRAMQLAQMVTPVANQFWLKVAGVWKETTTYIRVSGTWRIATPKIKILGTWRNP
jgi:hypothetical protein